MFQRTVLLVLYVGRVSQLRNQGSKKIFWQDHASKKVGASRSVHRPCTYIDEATLFILQSINSRRAEYGRGCLHRPRPVQAGEAFVELPNYLRAEYGRGCFHHPRSVQAGGAFVELPKYLEDLSRHSPFFHSIHRWYRVKYHQPTSQVPPACTRM